MSLLLDPTVYARVMRELVGDPDLYGDALLFAVAVVEFTRKANLTPEGRLRKMDYREVARMAFGPRGAGAANWRLEQVIRNDIPRYQPPGRPEECCAPMVRRDGECGRKAHEWVRLLDPDTGAVAVRGYCSRHWSPSRRDEAERARRAWEEAGRPEPEHNAGGVLRRHFPQTAPELYARVLRQDAPVPEKPPRRLQLVAPQRPCPD